MLKALELFGFKSFADKTRFEFPDGITVVVGPNGSGKSNVVDGIRWVLGEQSAKSLRGAEMADVIFKGSGTGTRKPANTAEVTIVFDNTLRLIDRNEDEIRVTRRVYRSGEGEYQINGEPCRLRDVKDLFRGTGVGADAYSLIEQGKVDTLLQASPRDRRAIFEEAAGISRFKAKKVESQRRLDRVQQNLLRLSDIVEEVERRLKSLRSQATKAQRYKEYTDRLKELRTFVAHVDWRQFSDQIDQLTTRLQELEARDAALCTDSEQAEQELRRVDHEIASQQAQLHELESAVATRRESIARFESDSRNRRRTLDELTREEQRFMRRLAGLSSRAGDIQLQLKQVQVELAEAQQQYEAAKSQADADQRQLDDTNTQSRKIEADMQDSRQQHTQQLRSVAMFSTKLSGLQSELTNALRVIERSTSQVEDVQQRLDAAELDLNSLLEREQSLQLALTAAEEELAQNERALQSSTEQLAALRAHHAEKQREHSGLFERSKVLEEIEQRAEGIGSGVKDLLSQATQDPSGPLGEIRGLVADLMEVHVDMAPLVDAALGPASQYLVIDGERLLHEIASGAIRTSGRVGLLSIPLLQSTSRAIAERRMSERLASPKFAANIANSPETTLAPPAESSGLLGAATEFITAEPRYQVLIQHLLGDTWFVDSLAHAFQLRQRYPGRYVTRVGEVVEANGLMYLGPKGSATGIVSRRSQLRSLRVQLQELELTIRQLDQQLTAMTEQHSQAQQAFKEATDRQRQSATEFAEHRAQTHTVSERVTHLRQSRDTLTTELLEQQARQHELQQELATSRLSLGELEQTISVLDALLRDAQTGLTQLHEQRREIDVRSTASKVLLAKSEQRVESLQAQAIRAQQDNDERLRAVQDARREAERCAARRVENEFAILQATSELSELYLQREQFEAALNGFSARQHGVANRRRELAKTSQQAQSKRRELAETRHRLELEAGQLSMQRDAITARLMEDYGVQVELLDAVALTAPLPEQQGQTATTSTQTPFASASLAHVSTADTSQDATALDTPAQITDDREDVANLDKTADIDKKANKMLAESPLTAEQLAAQQKQQREAIEQEISQLRRKISNIGAVNMESLEELQELDGRFGHLSQQYNDLVAAKDALERIIHKINADSRRMFTETLDVIRENFQSLFRRAFGGGHADIVVEEGVDILDCGIDIIATPPGKHSLNISLLSGGERALTAVTLLLAIFRVRPSPFCVLDEVDGPLDEANIGRFVAVLKEFLERTKVVIVTHSKKTMSAATTLYGVTMQESGVSKRVSVQFEDVSDDGHISADAIRREASATPDSPDDDEQAA